MELDSEVTIDDETFDSPAMESKNYDPDAYSESFIENVFAERVSAKFAAQAGAGRDELVLVVPDDFKNTFSDELSGIPDTVQRRLNNNGVNADPRVEIVTYDDIGT
ncbi:hypothetical protein [Halomicrobium urmianum]|uniref:hypothetical protein n=1 Tax=Halomicrobium urmianum TaxID=1586233 RepID=UPI001CD93E1E|nr:hypothetical protein [Halomicrobium urmianum]